MDIHTRTWDCTICGKDLKNSPTQCYNDRKYCSTDCIEKIIEYDENMELYKAIERNIQKHVSMQNKINVKYNQHTSDQHASDQHTADQHTADQHTSDQHASDQHASDQHASDQHTSDQESPAPVVVFHDEHDEHDDHDEQAESSTDVVVTEQSYQYVDQDDYDPDEGYNYRETWFDLFFG